jgi:peptidyl-dipeptidase Dcp
MKKLFIMLLIISTGAVSCKKETCENPFYCDWDTPFEVPPFDQIKFEHFKPAFLKGMEEKWQRTMPSSTILKPPPSTIL